MKGKDRNKANEIRKKKLFWIGIMGATAGATIAVLGANQTLGLGKSIAISVGLGLILGLLFGGITKFLFFGKERGQSEVMTLNNKAILAHTFLEDMYSDDYFPNFLVDKIKNILMDLCKEIEAKAPSTNEALYVLTHAATEKINDLEQEFEENESELETGAREAMGADFDFIVHSYGFVDADLEEVIAPRDW